MKIKRMRPSGVLVAAGVFLAVMIAALVLWLPSPDQELARGQEVARQTPRQALTTPALPLPQGVSHADDPVGGLRLEGMVTDAQDLPVGQAVVAIDSHPPRSVRTEQDGSFFFDNLAGRIYRILARKGKLVAGPVSWRLTESSEPVMLRLAPGGQLLATVSDLLDNSPVKGAEVRIETLISLASRADEQGQAAITGLGAGQYKVVARAAGYAPAMKWVEVAPAPDVTRLTMMLARGASLSGKVIDEEGAPIKGATVEAKVDHYHATGATAATDEAGAFTFPAMAADTYHLAASHPEMAPTLSRPVTVNGRDPRRGVVITLRAGGEISGLVRHVGGGAAGGAVVHLAAHKYWEGRGIPRKHVVCDGEGKFSVGGLMRAELSLAAVHPLATSSEVRVDLRRQRKARLEITLDRNLTISGAVVDAAGQPVPQAQVTGVSTRRQISMVSHRARARAFADAGGGFVLRGLKKGGYRLHAHRPGQGYYYSGSSVLAQSGDRDVRLVYAGTGGVKGRVLFDDGSAPALFWVNPRHGERRAFRGERGEFQLDRIPARSQSLMIVGLDFKPQSAGTVQVKPGEVADVGTITVKRGRSVRGQVTDSQGVAVDGALVLLDRRVYESSDWITSFTDGVNPWDKQARTGKGGSFIFRGVGDVALFVAAEHPVKGRSTFQKVPAGTADATVKLTLAGVASLEGTVTRQGAPVVADVTLSPEAQAKGEVNLNQTSDGDGHYRFSRLVPGRYRVRARRKTWFNERVREETLWTVVTARGSRLDIELPTGATLELSLTRGEELKASVNLCPGVVKVQTMKALDRYKKGQGKSCSHAFLTSGMNRASFHDVEPGEYSACVWLIARRIGESPSAMLKRDRNVYCQQVTVAAAPAVQSMSMNLK